MVIKLINYIIMTATKPRKQFGQHWLKSDKILNQIVKAAELSKTDRVLEIGPGTGILTQKLLPLVETLVAIEIDRDLCPLLAKKYGKIDNFLLLQGDFLEINIESLLQEFPKFQKPNKVVANIPYNITGPILEKLLGKINQPNPQPFDSIVLLVQKEVADRLHAKAGTKAFGALSVKIQYLAQCELICHVPANAFFPPPKVDSAVVRLHPRPIDPPVKNPELLAKLVHNGFASKRKMLRNNLQTIIDRDRLTQLLEQLNLNPQSRAEDLSISEWVALTNLLAVEN